MSKDNGESQSNRNGCRKKLREKLSNRIKGPSTSKSTVYSSESEEESREEDVKIKSTKPRPTRKYKCPISKEMLQTARLAMRTDYLREMIASSNSYIGPVRNSSKAVASSGGVSGKLKKLTMIDNNSDQDGARSLSPTRTSNLSNFPNDNSEENFNKNHPPAHKENPKTVDDESETDIVLSVLKSFYPEEHFTKLAIDLIDDTDNADIFFVHIPKSIDPRKLIGCTISTKKDTSLDFDGKNFKMKVSRDGMKPFSIMRKLENGQYGCKTLKPIANMVVQCDLKTQSPIVVDNSIKFPEELKKLTMIDNNSDQDGARSLSPTRTSNLSNFSNDNSEENFNKNHPPAQKEKPKTVDDESETDIVLSALKSFYPEEHFTKLAIDLIDDTDNADIFFVHIPKSIDPRKLMGCTISTKKDTNLDFDGKKFKMKVSRDGMKPFSIMRKLENGQYGCKMLKPIANMVVQCDLKTQSQKIVDNSMEFPEELKTLCGNRRNGFESTPVFNLPNENESTVVERNKKKVKKHNKKRRVHK